MKEQRTEFQISLLLVEKKNWDISDSERIYQGHQNMTIEGKPFLKWSEVGEVNSDKEHNFCRNPYKNGVISKEARGELKGATVL